MIWYIILILVEFSLLWIAYKALKDILSPAFISIFTFLCSTLLCFPMTTIWSIEICKQTVVVITLGLSCMIVACRLNLKRYKITKESYNWNLINVPYKKIFILITTCICLTFYYLFAVVKAGQFIGATNNIEAITAVKQSEDIEIDFVAKQGVKVVYALAYVHLYIFINNILCKSRLRNEIHHLIPVICSFLCCIFTGVRTDMLKLISAGIFITILLMRFKKIRLDKFFKYAFIAIVILAFGGASLNSLNKGKDASINTAYTTDLIVAYYIGSPIQVLNMKIEEGVNKYRDKTIWGRTTFSRQYYDLNKFGIYESKIEDNIGSVNVLLDYKNGIVANVDTIIGAPLIDFGLWGMMIYIFLIYWILSWFYYHKVLKVGKQNNRSFIIITYSFFIIIPVMAYYACLPNLIFTFSYFVQVFLIYLICKYYFISFVPCKKHNYE